MKANSTGQESVPDAAASRRGFLRTTSIAMIAGIPVMAGFASSAKAVGSGGPTPAGSEPVFNDIRKHENEHVHFLESALGSLKRPMPKFKNLFMPSFDVFARTSQALENTGVGAYLGAAPVITNKGYLAAAGSIMTVEARHAGYLNTLLGDPVTKQATGTPIAPAFDRPLTAAQVGALAGGFIASLNGGPPIDYQAGDDVSILNFALALEYLEAEFYNINVPRYFKIIK